MLNESPAVREAEQKLDELQQKRQGVLKEIDDTQRLSEKQRNRTASVDPEPTELELRENLRKLKQQEQGLYSAIHQQKATLRKTKDDVGKELAKPFEPEMRKLGKRAGKLMDQLEKVLDEAASIERECHKETGQYLTSKGNAFRFVRGVIYHPDKDIIPAWREWWKQWIT